MQKNLNIEKIIFKVVQIKFLAMHITNQKLIFDIIMVGNVLNIFIGHYLNILMIFCIKEACIILSHTMYCWLRGPEDVNSQLMQRHATLI